MPEPRNHLSPEELAVVRDALTGRPDWLTLSHSLEEAANSRDSLELRLVAMAFVYDFVPQSQDRREHTGGPYATMWESAEGTYPPRPGEVRAAVLALWRWVLGEVDDPIVQARLGDLVYVADGRSAHALGRSAAMAFAALAGEPAWEPLERADAMARALEIRAELNDQPGVAAAAEQAMDLVDDLLGGQYPGPPFIVLRALTALKRRPARLAELLERVIEHFKGTHDEASACAVAAEATSDPEIKQSYRRRELEAKISEAHAAEGLAKASLLSRAAGFAQRYGFGEQSEALMRELQEMPEEELGMQRIETSIELPTDEIRAQVDRLAGSGAADVFAALDRIALGVPPGGTDAEIEAEIDARNAGGIAHLFERSIMGPGSAAPHFVANDEASKRRAERGQARQLHAGFIADVMLVPLLHTAVEQHSRPSHDELAEHFSTELIGPERAERIARALELFWDGDPDASAHVLVPRLESILRDWARASGVPIVKQAPPGKYGGVIALGAVLAKLRELQPGVEWLDYLDALLCEPLAINLRNAIAHGLAPSFGAGSAALLLHAACYLRLLRPAAPATAS